MNQRDASTKNQPSFFLKPDMEKGVAMSSIVLHVII